MNASEETSSCPAEQTPRKRGRKHKMAKEEVREVIAYARLTQSLSTTLQATAAHWHIDESTLIFNILKFTAEKKRFTTEEMRALSKGNANASLSFFRRDV